MTFNHLIDSSLDLFGDFKSLRARNDCNKGKKPGTFV